MNENIERTEMAGAPGSSPSQTEIDCAYCRAAIYSALALGFQEPTDETLSRLMTLDSRASLAHAASLLYGDGAAEITAAIEALPRWQRSNAEDLAARHRLLFGHTARGVISPYETEYGNEALFQQPQELGDLMGFYRAFGLTPGQGVHERPDHVSCECEFLMFLALKEAYGLEQDEGDMLSETRKAERLFLRDHLGRFLPAFAASLDREDPAGFFGALAQLAGRFIAAECARLDVTLGPGNLGLRPAEDNNVPMACGNAGDCAALAGACASEQAEVE
ncbi:MAG: hypothetical protein FJ145_19765 [Deltaproteobacteria bacterium]|nr:hypothetical protein [Deltaproteobacteria bacterium]